MAAEMPEAAGAKNICVNTNVGVPGMANHEPGTARMGTDPKESVLNPRNQAHEVEKNLFVIDGACYVASASRDGHHGPGLQLRREQAQEEKEL